MTSMLNLSPDPRILPMLGEINLSQERCMAELIDNCIDAFTTSHESNILVYTPQIWVTTPQERNRDNAKVVVKDNGPGMSTERLERAVSAGWTGNDPINRLGLFGMGFNIATARLGGVTHVWTTEAGEDVWRGIEINFQQLIKEKKFETELKIKPKSDHSISGTEVIISKLKEPQLSWLIKSSNIMKLKKFLGQIYSAALQDTSLPFKIELFLNGQTVKPIRHCVWSDHQEGRVSRTRLGDVEAFQKVDVLLPSKKYCAQCWMWLSSDMDTCPTCGDDGIVITRQRRIRGWLGILRYFSETDYGIDFIRNGRKIELLDRSLFKWTGDSGVEEEYPIDDPRRRGRIVGEIHLDHCRVSYTKDRFERDDPAWPEMLEVIRGRGPLRPEKARLLGYADNTSPLYLLFQAFRRSTPSPKVAGAYANLLAVANNDCAVEYAEQFAKGVRDYQTDAKWFALIEEEDRNLLIGSKPSAPVQPVVDDDELDGIDPTVPTTLPSPPPSTPAIPPAPIQSRVIEKQVASLSQVYVDDVSAQRYDVTAFEVVGIHPALHEDSPWRLESDTKRRYKFYYDGNHPCFTSTNFLPLEALLAEIAHNVMLFSRDQSISYSFSAVLSSLRKKYHTSSYIDLPQLLMDARNELKRVASYLSSSDQGFSGESFYESLDESIKRMIQNEMAKAGVTDSQDKIANGEFLIYAPSHSVIDFVTTYPELYFDGKLWSSAYERIRFSDPDAAALARRAVLNHHLSLLCDIAWLANKDSLENDPIETTRITRARLALDILRSYCDE